MTNENVVEVSDMIKILVVNKCSANSTNHEMKTAFYCLLEKALVGNDLIEFCIENAEIDFETSRQNEVWQFMEQRKLTNTIPIFEVKVSDVNYMKHLLDQWQEEKFIEEFEAFRSKANTKVYKNLSLLLETAAARNMTKIVKLLLTSDVKVNEISEENKFKMPSVFIACYFGHHEVLEVLLPKSSLQFKFSKTKRNLLHQVCFPSEMHLKDRRKCFNLIIDDPRCTRQIINEEDENNFVPLYYAVQNGFRDFAMDLLRRNAALDHSLILKNLSKETQKNLFKDYMKKACYVKYFSDSDDSDEKELIKGPELKSNNEKQLFIRADRIALIGFSLLMIFFLIFSVIGIYRNIQEGPGIYNRSEIYTSGYKVPDNLVVSLSGGGNIKTSNKRQNLKNKK